MFMCITRVKTVLLSLMVLNMIRKMSPEVECNTYTVEAIDEKYLRSFGESLGLLYLVQ